MIPIHAHVSYLSGGVLSIVGFVRWRSISREMKLLVGLFLFTFLIDTSGLALALRGMNNYFLSHIETLVTYIALMTVFVSWETNPTVRRAEFVAILLFVIWWIVSKVTISDFGGFDSFTMPVAALLLVAGSVRTLHLLARSEEYSIFSDRRFWVSVAVMLYFSGSLLIVSTGNLLRADVSAFLIVYHLNWGLHIVSNLCYGGGLFCR